MAGIGASQAWINSAKIAKQSVLIAKIDYGDGTKFIGAASGPIFDSQKANGEPDYDQVFDGVQYPIIIVEPLPVATGGNDIRTGEIQTDNITISIEGFSEIMADSSFGAGNDFGFENRDIEIVQWVPGITTFAGCAPFKKGKMRGFAQRGTVVDITVQGQKSIINIQIPPELVTDSDAADTDQGLPEAGRGKPQPTIIGDHTFPQGNDSKSLDTASNLNTGVPCVPLGVDATGRHRWLISNHKLDEIAVAGVQAQLRGFDKKLNRFVRLANDGGTDIVVEQNDSNGCIISHLAVPQYIDYFYGKGTPTTDSLGTDITLFANPERVTDKDFTTFSRGSLDPDSFTLDFTGLIVPFGEWENQNLADSAILEIVLNWYGEATFAGGTSGADYIIQFAQTGAVATGTEPDTGGIFPDARMEDAFNEATKNDIATSIIFNFIALGNYDADDQVILDIYQMYKAIRYEPGEVLDLFFFGKGREYSVGRAGHAEGTAAGILIKNAAGVAESILRDDLEVTDIDTDGMDLASNAVDVNLAFSLINQSPGFDTLASVAYQSRSLIHQKANGDWTMTVIKKTYSSEDFVVDYNAIKNAEFTISQLEDIVTKSLVKFRESEGLLIAQTSEIQDTTMQTKYKVSVARSFLQFPANLIEADPSASNLNNFLLDFWKQPHRFGTFDADLEYAKMDVGSIIRYINVPRKQLGLDIEIDNTIAGQKILKYFLIFDVARSVNGASFEVVQLHEVIY